VQLLPGDRLEGWLRRGVKGRWQVWLLGTGLDARVGVEELCFPARMGLVLKRPRGTYRSLP
jgi:hypothetical protein